MEERERICGQPRIRNSFDYSPWITGKCNICPALIHEAEEWLPVPKWKISEAHNELHLRLRRERMKERGSPRN